MFALAAAPNTLGGTTTLLQLGVQPRVLAAPGGAQAQSSTTAAAPPPQPGSQSGDATLFAGPATTLPTQGVSGLPVWFALAVIGWGAVAAFKMRAWADRSMTERDLAAAWPTPATRPMSQHHGGRHRVGKHRAL